MFLPTKFMKRCSWNKLLEKIHVDYEATLRERTLLQHEHAHSKCEGEMLEHVHHSHDFARTDRKRDVTKRNYT